MLLTQQQQVFTFRKNHEAPRWAWSLCWQTKADEFKVYILFWASTDTRLFDFQVNNVQTPVWMCFYATASRCSQIAEWLTVYATQPQHPLAGDLCCMSLVPFFLFASFSTGKVRGAPKSWRVCGPWLSKCQMSRISWQTVEIFQW